MRDQRANAIEKGLYNPSEKSIIIIQDRDPSQGGQEKILLLAGHFNRPSLRVLPIAPPFELQAIDLSVAHDVLGGWP